MSKYRHNLPQLKDALFLTDGGLETTLIYHDGIELPYFAAFDLLKDEAGFERLRNYFVRYAALARAQGLGLVLEAPTWRANPDWAAKLGYDAVRLADANRKAIGLMLEIREEFESPTSPMVISGNLGPRGDGYRADARMHATAAQDYHAPQIETFAQTDADMVAAFTMTYVEEAIGVARAARAAGMPVAISFTLETDGRLPSGDTLAHAIERTDAEHVAQLLVAVGAHDPAAEQHVDRAVAQVDDHVLAGVRIEPPCLLVLHINSGGHARPALHLDPALLAVEFQPVRVNFADFRLELVPHVDPPAGGQRRQPQGRARERPAAPRRRDGLIRREPAFEPIALERGVAALHRIEQFGVVRDLRQHLRDVYHLRAGAMHEHDLVLEHDRITAAGTLGPERVRHAAVAAHRRLARPAAE